VTLTYTPGATFVVSGIAQDFRGANNYRANVTCDPMGRAAPSARSPTGSTAPACPADRSEPASRQRGPQHRPRTEVLAAGISRPRSGFRARRARRSSSSGSRAFNLLNHTNFRSPNGNRSAGGLRTITSTFDPRQLQLGFKLLW
jgi:hypothetical protein